MRIIVNCSCNLGDSSGASNKCIKGKWFEPQVTAATAGKTNLQVKDTGFSIKRSKHFNRLLVVIIYSYNMDATDLQWLHYFQYQFICRYFHSKLITDLVWNVRGGKWPSQFLNASGDLFLLLVLFYQQSKIQIYLIYCDTKQRKSSHV